MLDPKYSELASRALLKHLSSLAHRFCWFLGASRLLSCLIILIVCSLPNTSKQFPCSWCQTQISLQERMLLKHCFWSHLRITNCEINNWFAQSVSRLTHACKHRLIAQCSFCFARWLQANGDNRNDCSLYCTFDFLDSAFSTYVCKYVKQPNEQPIDMMK